jgi:hypothetical protein
MDVACERTGRSVERFVVQGRFAETPFYELRLEAGDPKPLQPLASALDAALAELNLEYRAKRSSGRLGPVRASALPPGALEQVERDEIARRRGRAEQYKHTYLLTDILDEG